ncbi:MAG: CRISPR-associated endonuclease Cas1 [Dehalococcoidia bacterium]|nr:MAG: CRISPR-associated endonuclease Cas1 [Dehalococcoidia bacterium]
MTTLYVNTQGATVQTRDGRLVVTQADLVLADLPIETVDEVTVVGRGVGITTPALIALGDRGVDVAFVSQRGRYYGRFIGARGGPAAARIAQARVAASSSRALGAARAIVIAKIHAEAALLDAHGSPADPVRRWIDPAQRVATLDALRGVEGAAAAAYFRAYAALLPPTLGFRGRAHRPPPDLVNALLSFGYTLLLQIAIGAIQTVGLDPYLGILHVAEARRPSFALDLIEPFRPTIDWLTLRLVSDGTISPADTTPAGAGLRLLSDARQRVLEAFEAVASTPIGHPLAAGRVSLRQAVTLDARAWARFFLGEAPTVASAHIADLWSAR